MADVEFSIFGTLIDHLDNVEKLVDGNAQRIEYIMACNFLVVVMGAEWCKINIFPVDDNPNYWLLNGTDTWMERHPIALDTRRVSHYVRVITLADCFITMMKRESDSATFNEARRRLRLEGTKSAYHEIAIAALLMRNGFFVRMRREVGVKGKDYDLEAFIDGQTLAIEITSKVDGPFRVATIKNTLKQKRIHSRVTSKAIFTCTCPRTGGRVTSSKSGHNSIWRCGHSFQTPPELTALSFYGRN